MTDFLSTDTLTETFAWLDRTSAHTASNVCGAWRRLLSPRLALHWTAVVAMASDDTSGDKSLCRQMRRWCKEIPWNVDIRLLEMPFRTALFVQNPWVAFCNGVATAEEIEEEAISLKESSGIFPDITILKDHPTCIDILQEFYPADVIDHWYKHHHPRKAYLRAGIVRVKKALADADEDDDHVGDVTTRDHGYIVAVGAGDRK